METIPVIDIGGLYSEKLEDRRAVAKKMATAASSVGFLYVKNHRVPQSAINNVEEAAKEIFKLPMEEKMNKYYIGHSKFHRGYVPRGEEVFERGKSPDCKEAWDLGPHVSEDHPLVKKGTPMLGPNLWPNKKIADSVNAYYNAVMDLSRLIFRAFALGLNLEESFFDSKMKLPVSYMRLVHYPYENKLDEESEPANGISSHTDYECFTILHTTSPGLEVMTEEGKWVPAPPIEGAFVVNIGDMLQVMSNGTYVATAHRVRKVKEERYSFPLFATLDFDEKVRPMIGSPEEWKYGSINSGEHMWAQLMQTYNYLIKRVEMGETELPKDSRKTHTFGYLEKYGQSTSA